MIEDQYLKTHQGLIDATEVVSAYVGSEPSRAAVVMLDLLIAGYSLDLLNVSPEDLQAKQAMIRQAMALRNLMAGDSKEIPKI